VVLSVIDAPSPKPQTLIFSLTSVDCLCSKGFGGLANLIEAQKSVSGG
jgi:hypothetical protein